MRTHNIIEEKLYGWVKLLTTGTTIEEIVFTHQNGIEPKVDYVAIHIDNMAIDNPVEMRYNNIDLQKQIVENAIYRGQATIQIRVISKENSFGIAEMMKARIYMTNPTEYLEAVNLGLGFLGKSLNMSFLENERNRSRCDFDATLHYTEVYQDIIQTIGKVTVIGYNSEDGTELVNVTIEEPGYDT